MEYILSYILDLILSVQYFTAYVTERFGKEETRKEFKAITESCNQKCRDADKKFRGDKENLLAEFGSWVCVWPSSFAIIYFL